jgi:hypothetical protein
MDKTLIRSRWPVRNPHRAVRSWHVGLAAALVAGAVLRLVWVQDMEYKSDEIYMFDRTRAVGVTEPWPWLGIESGVNLHNPGMSVWVFVVPGKLLGGGEDPTVLARVPQWGSIVALGLLVVFAFRSVAAEEREPWLWGIALAAVNPSVLWLHRKIWAQATLAPFSVLFLIGWWNRQRHWGAFLWGLVGACLGQIHMSGFFYAGGFVLWTALWARKNVYWGSWLAGSCVGALPLLPWIHYVLHAPSQEMPVHNWLNLLSFPFWWFWICEPLGEGVTEPLLRHSWEFLTYPVVAGQPTYLVGLLSVLAVGTGVLILGRAAHAAWQARRSWRVWWTGQPSQTELAVGAALWGFGLLLTATGCLMHRYYLLVAFPLQFVWLARLALTPFGGDPQCRKPARILLLSMCVAQFLVSAGFLEYIHVNDGAVHGFYGRAYRAQSEEEKGGLSTR